MEEKTTCIFFRSLFDAAERLYKTDPEAAYEIYRSYFRYAFCETEDIESKSEIAELLVRQNVESLNAAERRYTANVKNGQKGKEYGVLGKEYGSLGGRPRKGETREEYWERKRREAETGEKEPYTPPVDEKTERAHNLARNYKKTDTKEGRGESTLTTGWIKKNILSGQKCVYCGEEDWHKLGCDRIDNTKPHTPDNVVCSCSKCNIERGSMSFEEYWKKKDLPGFPPKTPLTIAKAISITEAISNTSSKSLSKTETDSISNTDSLDYYIEGFLDNPSKDFSCITTNIQYFFNRNESDLITLQERIKNKCGCEITLKDLVEIIKDKYVKKVSK